MEKKKILSILFRVITDLIMVIAIYYIAKFTLFNGKDLFPSAAFFTIYLIGSFLGIILRHIVYKLIEKIKKKPRSN